MIVCAIEINESRDFSVTFIDTEKLDPNDAYRIEIERVLSKPCTRPGGPVGSVADGDSLRFGYDDGARLKQCEVTLPATVEASLEMYVE